MNNYLMKMCDRYLLENAEEEYSLENVICSDEYYTVFLYRDNNSDAFIHIMAEHDDEGNVSVCPVIPDNNGFIESKLSDARKVN